MSTHSVFSMSGAYRWFHDACSASIRLTKGMDGGTNPQAEKGTAAHELGEFCIEYGIDPHDCIGMEFNKFIVDEDMANAVNLYVGWANSLSVTTGVKPELEKRVVMSSLGRDDVYGTSDFTLAHYATRTLYIGDYKNGYGLVDVVNNKQLIGYAIATLDTLVAWPHIDKVVTTIIQPNKQHADGCIRSHTYTTAELVEWQKRFAYSIQLAEDPTTQPVAGNHCMYCPRATCRARWNHVLNTISPDASMEDLSHQEIGHIYANIDIIKRFIERIEGEQLKITRQTGYVPEGYKPVNAIQRAKCEDEQGFVAEARERGINVHQMYEPKLLSKTALKKVVPSDLLNKYFVTPPKSVSIAKLNDNRPAIRIGSAAGVFKPVED